MSFSSENNSSYIMTLRKSFKLSHVGQIGTMHVTLSDHKQSDPLQFKAIYFTKSSAINPSIVTVKSFKFTYICVLYSVSIFEAVVRSFMVYCNTDL